MATCSHSCRPLIWVGEWCRAQDPTRRPVLGLNADWQECRRRKNAENCHGRHQQHYARRSSAACRAGGEPGPASSDSRSSNADTSLQSLEQLLRPKQEGAGAESRRGVDAQSAGARSAKDSNVEEVTAPLLSQKGAVKGTAAPTPSITLQQQLDRAYEEARRPQTKTPAQLRIQKRREYMAKVGKRNDSPFFALVGALVLVPPLVILGFAVATGYVDLFKN